MVLATQGCAAEKRLPAQRRALLLGTETRRRPRGRRSGLLHGRLRDDPGDAVSLHPALSAMRFSYVVLLLCCLAGHGASARPGLLQTLDGRTLNGDVQFANGAFTVDATNAVPLTNLHRLSFVGSLNPAPSGQGRGNGLLGFYFANTNLTGDPWVRLDESIDFDWGLDEPVPELPNDHF